MPTCNQWLLEVLFFYGDSAGGIHITQDAILRPDEVRMGIETGIEEGNSYAAPAEIRVGIDADRRGQKPLFVSRVYRKRCEQFSLERRQTPPLTAFLNGALHTFRADAVLTFPTRIIFAQNSRDVLLEFGSPFKQVWV